MSHNQPPTEHKETGDKLRYQIIGIVTDEDQDPQFVSGWHLDHEKAADRIMALITQSHTQLLQEIEEAIGPDTSTNTDGYNPQDAAIREIHARATNAERARIRNILESKRI